MTSLHVVTGASAGIGRGTADALVARGEQVVGVARSAPAGTVAVRADIGTVEGRAAVIDAVGAAPVASIVHAAASRVPVEGWTELDAEALTTHFRIHVAAPIELTAALAAATNLERAVLVDSYAATTPRVGWSAYAIVKAAAQMAFRAAAAELPDTVVLRIFPGAVDTGLLRDVLDADPAVPAVQLYRGVESEGRVSTPDQIGTAIASLLLDTPLDDLRATEEWQVGHAVAPE